MPSVLTPVVAGDRVTVVTKPHNRCPARYEGATVRPSPPSVLRLEWYSGGTLHCEDIPPSSIDTIVVKN